MTVIEATNTENDFSGTEYYIDDNKLHRISHSSVTDEVSNSYLIDFNKPLPQFDSLLAKAYNVTNKSDSQSDKCYALILDTRYTIRLAEINILLDISHENFTNVVGAQIVYSSLRQEDCFAVIVEKPHGMTLAKYIKDNGAISEDAIVEKIVSPINSVIKFLASKKVVHGNINLENVYIDSSGKITVGECISGPSGCMQKLLYENINRAASLPLGKGQGNIGSTDYYALGVLAAIMLRGKNPAEGVPENILLDQKFTDTTYRVLVQGMEIPPHILDFLRGVINDKKKEIWSGAYVDEWIKGRRFNLLPPADNLDAGRPIVFNGKKYWNKRYLAHGLYLHWAEAKFFIRDNILIRWIERSVQNSDLAEKMEILSNRSGGDTNGNFDKDDELLAQYILLLDPNGPVRLNGFSAMLDGIGPLLAQGYAENNSQYLDAVQNIIIHSIISYWGGFAASESTDLNNIQEAGFVLQRCTELLRKRDAGFGLERCLYELNPTISCQSPLPGNKTIFSIGALLKRLNDNNDTGNKIIDRQIAAFLSCRLELPARIRITSLMKFPDFAADIYIQALALLSLAQQTSKVGLLEKLSEKVIKSLGDVIDTFHSKYVRESLIKSMEKISKKGNLSEILQVISDPQYLVRDRLGFRRAVTKYRNNAIQIIRLSNRKAINNIGYRYGLQLSVLISFFLAVIVVMVLTLKAI